MSIYNKMTNYKNFYNAWQSFAKPKRELLLENMRIPVKFNVGDYLRLTTDVELMKMIKDDAFEGQRIEGDFDPKKAGEVQLSVNVDDSGNAEVVYHEGRHRAYALKLAKMKQSLSGIIADIPEFAKLIGLNISEEDMKKEIDRIFIYGESELLTNAVANMSTSNEKKRKTKLEAEKKLKQIFHLVDAEDKRAEKTAQINGVLTVANKDNINFNRDIRQFIGEKDKSVIVPRYSLGTPRQVVKNVDNPLQITEPTTVEGYDYYPKGKFQKAGIMNYVSKIYHNDSALQEGGYPEFIKLLNNAYTVTDSNGKEYQFGFGQRVEFFETDPELERRPELRGTRYKPTGMKWLKLEPQPYVIYSKNPDDPDYTGKDIANSLTYTIKKK